MLADIASTRSRSVPDAAKASRWVAMAASVAHLAQALGDRQRN
jgi:hypothetical protein